MPTRTGPPTVAGRWSRLPDREANATRRTTARAEALLERHGVLTRGAVMAEQVVGRLLGGLPGAAGVRGERPGPARLLRRDARRRPVRHARARSTGCAASPSPDRVPGGAVVLAATDPANVYGAALPWPERPAAGDPDAVDVGEGTGRRRKAVGPPGRPQGRRAGGAGRRRAGALRRARRQDPAVVDRGRARAQGGGDGAVRRGVGRGAGPDGRCRRPTARPCTSPRRCRPRCRPPGSPPPRGACACAADRPGAAGCLHGAVRRAGRAAGRAARRARVGHRSRHGSATRPRAAHVPDRQRARRPSWAWTQRSGPTPSTSVCCATWAAPPMPGRWPGSAATRSRSPSPSRHG